MAGFAWQFAPGSDNRVNKRAADKLQRQIDELDLQSRLPE
jgi:hypothetical protein